MEGSLRHRMPGPSPRISDFVDLGWVPTFAFLTSSLIMRILLAWGYMENYWLNTDDINIGENRVQILAVYLRVIY